MHGNELLRGTIQTIVLKIISDYERMYGYEIVQCVRDLSEGMIVLTEGALYPTLHKLEADGLLDVRVEAVGKRLRKYYSLTPEGRIAATEKVREFAAFVRTMNFLLRLDSK